VSNHDLRAAARRLTSEEVVADLRALSVVEDGYSPGLSITVRVDGDRCEVSDDGRGMRLTPDRGDTISHAERALTSTYPCEPANAATRRVLGDRIWGERGSLGPATADLACPSLRFISERDGEAWAEAFRWGAPSGPPEPVGPTDRTGTTIAFETAAEIDVDAVAALIGALMSRLPERSIVGPVGFVPR
jgi:DNA gyrase/topoisomerase IV subunit B